MIRKSVKRIRTKRSRTRKLRIKGGSFNTDQLTVNKFKEHIKSAQYNTSAQFIKDGVLTDTFSDELPVEHDMYMLLKKNLIETITLNEILNDVYKLIPIPSKEDVDFDIVPKKIETLEELFEITPNEMVEWNGFLFKFYDFNIKSHQEYKKSIKFNREVCKKSIKEEYFIKSMSECDYLITVSDSKEFELNKEERPDLTNIYAFTMNNTLNYGTSLNTYTSTTCSMELTGDDEVRILSFGLLLRYIMLNYLKSIGFVNGYNDASHKGLLPYYSRWNYRLGKESCDLNNEETTVKHDELIKLNNSEALDTFYESLTSVNYESSYGYRMKLCGINLAGWREYLLKTNTGIKERLEANKSVYTYYIAYQNKVEKKRKAELLDKQLIEFKSMPLEEQKRMATNFLEQIIIYDNQRIYEIVIDLIKNGVITFNDVKSDLMSHVKQTVASGPYIESPFARNFVIKKIVERGDLPKDFIKS